MQIRRIAAAVTGAALAVAVPGVALAGSPSTPHRAAAHAATTTYVVPTGGVTMLKLADATAAALTQNGVKVRLASEARMTPSGIAFPIRGGLVDAKTLAGRITHSGGLTFVAGGKRLTIRDFVINTSRSRLSAYVDQAKVRIPVLKLDLSKAHVSSTATTLGVTNVGATLTRTAADALNQYFSTSLFTAGLPIGTARVSARIVVVKG